VTPWQNLRVSRISLLGFSTAGIETAIEVPSLGLVLDLGRCSRTAVNQPLVLVSHRHLDHVGAVVQHAARRAMMNMGESVYVVPASIAADVERSVPCWLGSAARERRGLVDADGTDERVRVAVDQFPPGCASAVDLGHA
jgi:hypothetical protein